MSYFSSLDMISFSSLNIFKISHLSLLFKKPNVLASLGQFLLTASFPVYGPYFLVFFPLSHNFLLTADQFKYCNGVTLEIIFSSYGKYEVLVYCLLLLLPFVFLVTFLELILSSLHPCPMWLLKSLQLMWWSANDWQRFP